jgi:hypothetical protein
MRSQVVAAAEWLRGERKRLGWSLGELLARIRAMADDFLWEGDVPDVAGLRSLEAEELKRLPRWFKLVRYAVDRADVDDSVGLRWLSERNYFYSTEPLKMARPWLFEDECRFINTLDGLEEDRRRALRAFVSNYATRQCYQPKEEFARVLLAKFNITASVLNEQDSELVERFQALRADQRDMVLEMMRQIVPDSRGA